jgi:hypothetical protein
MHCHLPVAVVICQLQRYQRLPPPAHCSHNSLQRCNTCNISCSSNTSSSSSSDYGYQWPVMQLLQQGSCVLPDGNLWPVDEAGPLGLNCCGLLDSHHMPDLSLVGGLQTAQRVVK